MLELFHADPRPGPGWHRHGTTTKSLPGVTGRRLLPIRLLKQRWLDAATGHTRHDRPVWDSPHAGYALDVVVLTLHAWLLSQCGVHLVDWPWDDTDRPCTRTVQRWAAALAPHADDWLQRSRERLMHHVAPRPLEDLLPAGGIPPPEGARLRNRQGDTAAPSKLRDVVWLLENVAQAQSISIRTLLVVARWRWARNC